MNTGTAQVKIWYPLDKINSYTTNTVVIVNENNLTLRTNVTLSSFFLLSCSKLQESRKAGFIKNNSIKNYHAFSCQVKQVTVEKQSGTKP